MSHLRNSAKAIIIRDGSILLTRNEDVSGLYYLFPGGGQEPGETLHDALRRECREEIAAEIIIGPLRFIREYIGAHHEFAEHDSDSHQIEFMFLCDVKEDYEPRHGHTPDTRQVAVEWVELSRLHECAFYPKALIPYLVQADFGNAPVYLGDVN